MIWHQSNSSHCLLVSLRIEYIMRFNGPCTVMLIGWVYAISISCRLSSLFQTCDPRQRIGKGIRWASPCSASCVRVVINLVFYIFLLQTNFPRIPFLEQQSRHRLISRLTTNPVSFATVYWKFHSYGKKSQNLEYSIYHCNLRNIDIT